MKTVKQKNEPRNIGIPVKPPSDICTDKQCPFHGALSVRGQVLVCTVVSTKMKDSILVKREFMHFLKKYERFEKRSSKYSVHCPPCIKVKPGDQVKIAECRPLSKTISFVTIEKI